VDLKLITMETKTLLLAIASIFVFASCENDDDDDKDRTRKFTAGLSGGQEVPANSSTASGEAIFELSDDGMELSYTISVEDIDSVSMAHIHIAPEGENGPVVVWLYPPAPPAVLIPGVTDGVLQEGVITEANLLDMLAGLELSELIDLMATEEAYVNVHTGPFPGGEIRGQILEDVTNGTDGLDY